MARIKLIKSVILKCDCGSNFNSKPVDKTLSGECGHPMKAIKLHSHVVLFTELCKVAVAFRSGYRLGYLVFSIKFEIFFLWTPFRDD